MTRAILNGLLVEMGGILSASLVGNVGEDASAISMAPRLYNHACSHA